MKRPYVKRQFSVLPYRKGANSDKKQYYKEYYNTVTKPKNAAKRAELKSNESIE